MELYFLSFIPMIFGELVKLVRVDVLGHCFWNDAC